MLDKTKLFLNILKTKKDFWVYMLNKAGKPSINFDVIRFFNDNMVTHEKIKFFQFEILNGLYFNLRILKDTYKIHYMCFPLPILKGKNNEKL